MRTISQPALLGAKITVGTALLLVVISQVPFGEVLISLNRLAAMDIVVAVALYFAAHGVNALKLRLLLPQLSIPQALRFTMIAVLYGTALPGQLAGDAVKAFRLTRAASRAGNVSATIAAVTVDKAIGLFALLFLTAVGMGLSTQIFGAQIPIIVGTILAAFVVLFVVLLIAPLPGFLRKWTGNFGAWRRMTLRTSTLLQSLSMGVIFQSLSIAVFLVLGASMGLELSAPLWAVVVGLVSIVLLLPVTIAGIGLRDGSLVAVVAVLGQSESAALALSLVLLLLNIVGAAVGLLADVTGSDEDT